MSQDKINTRQHREIARERKAPKYCTTTTKKEKRNEKFS